MTEINENLGWTIGDDIRVLIAAGLPVGQYQITQIRQDMNNLGTLPTFVSNVLDLLDQYDATQQRTTTLNNESEGKILVKADVLEWSTKAPGTDYGPEREIQRIRELLNQYFASSILFSNTTLSNTILYRS